MCARAVFLLNSLLATTCVTGISLKPLSLSEASTAALDKSPEEAAALADLEAPFLRRFSRDGKADATAQTEDQNPDEKNAETGKDEGAADNKEEADKTDDNKADDKDAADNNAAEAPQEASNTDATPAATEALPPVPEFPGDGNNTDNDTDNDNLTLTELLDQITPNTIYLGVGQKIQDAYQEVSKAVQKFEQLDHFIMGDFEKKLADIKGHYVQIYNKVQKKVKAIQTEVKQAKDNIQQDPAQGNRDSTPMVGK